ncbi:MAG: HIT domain-containing protein [Candidatus Micrarchaeota archaeon]
MIRECIFCKIASGKAKARLLSETQHTISFLDSHPKARGHVLVVPKKHFKTIWEMPSEVRCELYDEAARVGEAAMHAVEAKGLDVTQHYWPFVPEIELKKSHAHVHLIPRDRNDAIFRKPTVRLELSENEVTRIAEKIRAQLKERQTKLV